MEGVDMKPRAWNKTIKVLKVCHLYIPGSYKWRDSLKKYRITMFVLRALGTAWTGLAAFGVGKSSGTLDVYKMVARYAVLRAPPYSPPIYHTLLVSTVWSILAFTWNLLCCFLITPVPWHLALSVFDVIISATLASSQVQMYKFIPISNETCYGDISKWNVPSTGQPNFYVMAANLTDDTAAKVCSRAVSAATWQVSILAYEGLISILSIMFLLPSDHLFSIGTLPWVPFRIATVVLREPFYLLHYITANRNSSQARLKTKKDIELRSLIKPVVYTGRFTTKLQQVLALEEAVLVIASHLHYHDLIALSRTNKPTRELIFPHRDLHIRKAKLKATVLCVVPSPGSGAPQKCWNCNIPICHRPIPWQQIVYDRVNNTAEMEPGYHDANNTPPEESCAHVMVKGENERKAQSCLPEQHEKNCKPHCSWCYYTQISRHLGRRLRAACTCVPFANREVVCANCVELEDVSLIRGAKVAELVRQKAREARECYGCGGGLGDKVWWICAGCKKQCGRGLHAVDRVGGSKEVDR